MVMGIVGPITLSGDDPWLQAAQIIRRPMSVGAYNHAGAAMHDIVSWLHSVGGEHASAECLKALESLRLYRFNYEQCRAAHEEAYNNMTPFQRAAYEEIYGPLR